MLALDFLLVLTGLLIGVQLGRLVEFIAPTGDDAESPEAVNAAS